MDKSLKALGKRIRTLRLDRNLTQEQLAEQAGVSLKHLGELERGRGNPTLELLDRLASGLDISMTELFDLEYQRPTDKELSERLKQMIDEATEEERRLAYRILCAVMGR